MADFCVQNGQYVVSGSEDHKIYMWDLQSRKIAQILEGHKGELNLEKKESSTLILYYEQRW